MPGIKAREEGRAGLGKWKAGEELWQHHD